MVRARSPLTSCALAAVDGGPLAWILWTAWGEIELADAGRLAAAFQ